jgi:hypothetical protein
VIFTNYPIEKKGWVSILGADRVSRIGEGWMFRRTEFHAVKESRQARLEGKNKEKLGEAKKREQIVSDGGGWCRKRGCGDGESRDQATIGPERARKQLRAISGTGASSKKKEEAGSENERSGGWGKQSKQRLVVARAPNASSIRSFSLFSQQQTSSHPHHHNNSFPHFHRRSTIFTPHHPGHTCQSSLLLRDPILYPIIMTTWLSKQKKGDLQGLAERAGVSYVFAPFVSLLHDKVALLLTRVLICLLPVSHDNLLKEDLVASLDTHLRANSSKFADDKAFAEFYERSGSPIKKGRPSATEGGEAKPPRRRTLAPKPDPGST